MKLLVTGASGFIGSFLVEHGIDSGMQVWAGVRETSSRQYLQDDRIHFIELDFGNETRLQEQLSAHKEQYGGWDYVIHAAGATKCRYPSDFFRINYDGTRCFVETLIKLSLTPKSFVYLSSLSVYGPVREAPQKNAKTDINRISGEPLKETVYLPINEQDTASPNTAYGKSKWMAESYLKGLSGFPYVILRPTGVYGPREKDYFLMAKTIAGHLDFSVGYRPQEITFIYVKDLVQASFLALEKGISGKSYFVSDGHVYDSRAFSDLIQKELGVSAVLHVKAPLWFLKLVCTVSGTVSRWLSKSSTLNKDKYFIMKQRNWQCDIRPLIDDLGYAPAYDLDKGVAETIAWYKKEKWL